MVKLNVHTNLDYSINNCALHLKKVGQAFESQIGLLYTTIQKKSHVHRQQYQKL